MKTLHDLYIHFLRDVLYAERHSQKMLRRMARRAETDGLAALFDRQADAADKHIERIEAALEATGKAGRGVRCEAMDGVLDETTELMGEAEDGPTRDTAMVAAAQAMVHYEVARYGTIVSWAGRLGYKDAAKALKTTLNEAKKADEALTAFAADTLEPRAMAA